MASHQDGDEICYLVEVQYSEDPDQKSFSHSTHCLDRGMRATPHIHVGNHRVYLITIQGHVKVVL